jgi:hypothetical protein
MANSQVFSLKVWLINSKLRFLRLPKAKKVDYLAIATNLCHEAGLTGVTDAGLTKPEIMLLDSLHNQGN